MFQLPEGTHYQNAKDGYVYFYSNDENSRDKFIQQLNATLADLGIPNSYKIINREKFAVGTVAYNTFWEIWEIAVLGQDLF
jgi:hypothetical protein